MPVKSKAQFRLMAAIANNPRLAKEKNISQTVAKEFIESTGKNRFKKLKEKISNKNRK